MKLFKLSALVIFILGMGYDCKAYDFVIKNATIYVSGTIDTLKSPEWWAAKELQRCIRKMTGVDLDINRTQPSSGLIIVIGEPATNSLIDQWKSTLQLGVAAHEQRIAVRRADNHHILFLAGKTAPAALWATYTFMQDHLGVRWFWPGDSGEFIPENSNPVITGTLSILQVPRIQTRTLSLVNAANAVTTDVDTWMARNRMNVSGHKKEGMDAQTIIDKKKKGFKLRIAGHIIRMDSLTLVANPSWAALRSTNPANRPPDDNAQLCWGNAGVQAAIIDSIRKWQDDNPDVDIIHFYPADNQGYCIGACGPCNALPGNNDVSTRWQEFSKLIIAGVNRPSEKFWTYAYQGYKPAPQVEAAPFEYIGYTLYEVCYRHPFMTVPHTHNSDSDAEINAWTPRLTVGEMGIRGYEYIPFTEAMYVPLVKWETEQMDWMENKGLTGYMSELRPYGYPLGAPPERTNWNTNRINLYAAARAMWSDITPDSIINDWHRTIYGPAYEPMRNYYNDFETTWRDAGTDLHIKEYGNAAANEVTNFLSPQKIGQLNNYFTEARNEVETVTDTALASRINKQIDLESKMLKEWQMIYYYATETAERYRTQVGKVNTIPGINDNTGWDSIAPLQSFIKWSGDTTTAWTKVKMAWTTSDLGFQIVCKDADVANRVKDATAHDDDQILEDENVEILIQANPDKNEYIRLVVNSKTSAPYRYSAYSKGGTNFDKSWSFSPYVTTSSKESIADDTWTLNIKIPFAALGITAADGSQFKIMIKRGRVEAGASDSGWPDAAFYRQNHFGVAKLVNKVTNPLKDRIILYDENHSGKTAVSVEFQKREWSVSSGLSGETALQEELDNDAAVLLLRYKEDANGSILSHDFYQDKIIPFIEKGRVVILTGASDNVNDLFPGLPDVTFKGDTVLPHNTVSTAAGNWLTVPNNLNQIFSNITPVPYKAYNPASGWRSMANRQMLSDPEMPYLLSHPIGDGILVLTTSNLGYGGGYEIFGSKRLLNVVKLVENLRAEQDADHPYTEQLSSSGEQNVIMRRSPEKISEKQDVFTISRAERKFVHTVISASEQGNARIRIVDIYGRQLADKKIELQTGINRVTIPVTISDNTIYIATLNMGGKDFSVKFLKK